MALPEEPLSIVEQWKKKSYEMASVSNDSIVSLVTKGIDTMAVVLSKKSDVNRVKRALASLGSEHSLSLEFDNIRNDEVRSLVYGLIESLHFTLTELTKEKNQVKDCGEMFTQTDQEISERSFVHSLPSDQMKESAEIVAQIDQDSSQPSLEHPLHSNDSSHNECDYSHEEPPINWLEVPKEEIFDESAIKNEDIWGDEIAIKDEDMPYDDVDIWGDEMAIKDEDMSYDDVIPDTHNADGDIAGDSVDISSIVHDSRSQSEVYALNNMGADFANEDVDDTMNDSMANEIMGEDKESSVRAQSEMPALNYVGDEPNFEIEDNDESVNEKDNETIEEDGAKDSSETVEVENKRRSSRNVSRRVALADSESLDNSDDNNEPLMKKSKTDSLKMKIRKSSDTIEKKIGSASLEGKSREMKCTECEFQTTSGGTFTQHLRHVHFTTLKLAGLAFRCDCGVEIQSPHHKKRDKCDIANFTVVRKREGPIQRFNDEKTTPQCLLCEEYPTTAHGYISHLQRLHNTYLSYQGIWLECSCGAKYRNRYPDSNHTKECTRRDFSLHKIAVK